MKSRFLCLMILLVFSLGKSVGQVVLYSENFNSGSAGWNLSGNGAAIIPGSSPGSNGASAGFWVVNNVGTNIDGSNNLHPTCSGLLCTVLGAPGPLYNAGGAGTFTNIVAHMLTDIPAASFSGPGPFSLEFDWICQGGILDAGDGAARLIYSINGGTSWLELPFDYIGQGTTQQQAITINSANFPGFIAGTTPFRIGFRWFYFASGGGVPSDPPMIVDNIQVLGPAASNTITTNAPNPVGPYCAGATITVPFTSTGTFAAGNIYTVQLSDASGSFATPVNIGNLNSTANSGNISATIPGGTPTGTGYLIRVVSNNPTTTGSTFGPFTVNPVVTPSVSISANPGTTICAGASVTFTATPVNGGTPTYQWQVNGTNVSGATSSTFTSTTLNNNDVVRVIMTSTAPCASPASATSNAITMTVNAVVTPSVSISANPGTTICAGASVTFTATPVNGGTPTYQWQVNGTNVGGATSQTFTSTTLNNNDVVSLVMTSTAACANPLSANSLPITISVVNSLVPSVTVSANPGSTICAGSLVTFTAAPVNGGSSPSFQWEVNGTPVSGATASTFSSSGLNDGDQVAVTITSNDPCANPSSVSSVPLVLTVQNTLLTAVAINLAQTLPACPGDLLDFTATPINGGLNPTFQWQINGVDVTGATGASFSTSSLINGDVVTVVLTSSDLCASPTVTSSIPFNVQIGGLIATVSISVSSDTICSGATPTFTATPLTGGGPSPTFVWTINGVNAGSSSVFTPSSLNDGDMVVATMTPSDPCYALAVNSNPIIMTVLPQVVPAITLTASSDTICQGEPLIFSTVVSGGGSSPGFQWLLNGNPIAGQTGSTLNSPTGVSLSNNDVVSVILTSADICANPTSVSSNAVTITVSAGAPPPTISISTSTPAICVGDLASFSASVTNGGTAPQIQWQVNGVDVPGGTGVSFSSLTLNNSDVITATVISNAACASSVSDTSNNIVIVVNPQVTPTVTVTANPSTVCQGQAVTFSISATGTGSAPTFQWFLNGLALPGETGSTYTNNLISGSDLVSVQMNSNELCLTVNPVNSANVNVSVLPPITPSVTLSVNDSIICSNESPVFTAIFTNGGTTPIFNWYVGGVLAASTALPTYSPAGLSNGQSVVCELVSNYQCATPPTVSSPAITITVSPQPVVDAGADVRTPKGTPVQLSASFNAAYDYFWNPGAGLNCTACINPLASPDVSTTYIVEAKDTLSGCIAFDSVRVDVFELIDIFVPTAFSPNKDQNNDVLFVRGNGIRDIEFNIYNRNGELLFKSLTQSQGWDGTFKGQDVDSGVYTWVLTGTYKDGNSISTSGNVTLQR